MLISVEATGKHQLQAGQECMGDAAVSSHCSMLNIPWPKPADVLWHFRKGETNSLFSIFIWGFLWPHPQGYEDVNILLSIHGSNCLHNTWKFRKIFEVTTYNSQQMHSIAICN
jgi:hypothetical protein